MISHTTLDVTGVRFTVTYLIKELAGQDALSRAEDLCVEQTIEFPAKYLANDDIRGHVVGQVVSCDPINETTSRVVVSYAHEVAGDTLTQLMNVMFGNISIQPGVKLQRFDLPEGMLSHYKGPRFGIPGLRKLSGEPDAPLICTALKPMGLSPEALACQAYRFAVGGVHFIKDDHGLADQSFAPFRKRVKVCADAVKKANEETGYTCRYLPMLSGPAERIVDDAYFAKGNGAGGLLIAPGLVGWDMMRRMAEDEDLSLPIMCHPAMLGSFTASPENGMSQAVVFGQFARLAGADMTVYPNFGGRFSFSVEECVSVQTAAMEKMANMKPIFAAPGGGMNFQNVPEMRKVYGNEIMFLVGGALHQGDGDITANSKKLRELVIGS